MAEWIGFLGFGGAIAIAAAILFWQLVRHEDWLVRLRIIRRVSWLERKALQHDKDIDEIYRRHRLADENDRLDIVVEQEREFWQQVDRYREHGKGVWPKRRRGDQ